MNIQKEDSTHEKLYSPSQWCNGRVEAKDVVANFIMMTENESRKVRAEYSCKTDLKYGSGPRQVLDLFEPLGNNCCNLPTFVYLHGGYWQELSVNKENSCYCVAPLIKAGIRVVIADYDLCPEVSLNRIVQEIEELIQYLENKGSAENWGPLWLGGHSAGAHLAASMLHSEVQRYISGLVLISGIYDLRPLITTSVNAALNLTNNEAAELSPLLELSRQTSRDFNGPIVMAVGEHESPAFHQQQIDFSMELKKREFNVKAEVVIQMDHFTIAERLCNFAYFLTQVIMNIILQNNVAFVPENSSSSI